MELIMSDHSLDRFVLSRKLSPEKDKLYKVAAKSYLYYLGNKNPTLKQLTNMKDLLFNVWLRWEVVFDQRLTDREKECLFHASHGKNAKEIACLLKVTESTVRAHQKAILSKLICRNLNQAVSIGIKYGCLV
jgi:DNA-binding CsgD family transcriptional regulator